MDRHRRQPGWLPHIDGSRDEHVLPSSSGWKAKVATAAGWAFLAAALTSALIRVWPPSWFASAEELTQDTSEAWSGLVVATVWIVMSVSFVALAVVLLRSETWPTWLGIVLIPLGILPLLVFLPLFYWVGAVLLGVVVLIRSRNAHIDAQAASGPSTGKTS